MWWRAYGRVRFEGSVWYRAMVGSSHTESSHTESSHTESSHTKSAHWVGDMLQLVRSSGATGCAWRSKARGERICTRHRRPKSQSGASAMRDAPVDAAIGRGDAREDAVDSGEPGGPTSCARNGVRARSAAMASHAAASRSAHGGGVPAGGTSYTGAADPGTTIHELLGRTSEHGTLAVQASACVRSRVRSHVADRRGLVSGGRVCGSGMDRSETT
jgi:hypothetical protein